jgi:hypothetical protein
MNKKDLLRNSLADISELLENQTGINHLEEDYETDSFEDFENYEMLEPEYMQKRNAALRQGQNATKAGQTADSAMLRTYGNKWRKAKNAGLKRRPNAPISAGKIGSYSALYDIVISRPTANITSALPIVLFAPKYFTSNYTNFFSSNPLPAGVTLAITTSANGNVLFTFTSGANIDVITISCNQNPYISFLENLKTSAITLTKNFVRVSSTNSLSQFGQPVNVLTRSLYGKASQDNFTPSSFLSPDQQQTTVLAVPMKFEIDGVTGWVTSIDPTVNTIYTFNSFVSESTSIDRKTL